MTTTTETEYFVHKNHVFNKISVRCVDCNELDDSVAALNTSVGDHVRATGHHVVEKRELTIDYSGTTWDPVEGSEAFFAGRRGYWTSIRNKLPLGK